jgi:hypothetical protein
MKWISLSDDDVLGTALPRTKRGHMGKQVRCASTQTKTGKPCRNPAMVGYSRCQLHRGEWSAPQKRRRKKR